MMLYCTYGGRGEYPKNIISPLTASTFGCAVKALMSLPQ
jgi:hypothetical protein